MPICVGIGGRFILHKKPIMWKWVQCHQGRLGHITTHLLSIERADWPKLHDMFKARDAKAWQREFPVGFPVRVRASSLLLTNIFLDIVARIESWCVIKAKERDNDAGISLCVCRDVIPGNMRELNLNAIDVLSSVPCHYGVMWYVLCDVMACLQGRYCLPFDWVHSICLVHRSNIISDRWGSCIKG